MAEVSETAIWVLAHSGQGHTYCDALPGMRADIDQHAAFVSSDFFVEHEEMWIKPTDRISFWGPIGAA
jgi:hypothetical protein